MIQAVAPYTLLSISRLRSLWALGMRALAASGAFVECGSWNGGSGALLAHIAKRDGRHTWLFDSFEGLPEPTAADLTPWGELGKAGDFKGSLATVEKALTAAQADPSTVHVIKGWFSDTLPSSVTGPIALLHIDVDWADSTHAVLASFYDRVVSGGVVVIDDYGFWQGLRQTVDQFLESTTNPPVINRSSYPSVWMSKP